MTTEEKSNLVYSLAHIIGALYYITGPRTTHNRKMAFDYLHCAGKGLVLMFPGTRQGEIATQIIEGAMRGCQ